MITEIKDYGDKTIWEIISDTLVKNGFKVYPPATSKGECIEPYIVLKQDGVTKIPGLSSERVFHMVMLYVPKERYSYLARYEMEVKEAMKELYPMVISAGETNTDYYDDNYNAHMRYLLYRSNVKINHF